MEDEKSRTEMESELENWDQDELLAALAEFQESTENVSLILRATTLSQTVMGLSFLLVESDVESDAEGMDMDLERVKDELSRMEGQISDSDESDVEDMSPVGKTSIPAVKGWKLWDKNTPWVPKPIGIV